MKTLAVESSVSRLALPASVLLGLLLRLHHYLRDPAMWHDEAALVLNVLRLGFRALLGPLLYAEAGPPLFLWVERAAALTLGDGTYALRLVPFLASGAALLLFVPVARRLLPARAAALAVFLMAVSDRLLWHACEAKPYSTDVLAAVVVARLFLWIGEAPRPGRLFALAVLAPPLVFLSFPSCFLLGGLLLGLLPAVSRASRKSVAAFGLAGVTLLAAFAFLYLGPVRAQRNPAMDGCWVGDFPDFGHPLSVPGWVLVQTAGVVDYPLKPLDTVVAPLAALGAVWLWGRGQKARVTFLLTPVALAFVASLLRSYPYSGTRVLVYAAPAAFLLVAAGIEASLAAIARNLERLRGPRRLGVSMLRVLLVLLPLLPAARAAYKVAFPWPRADAKAAAAYVLGRRLPDEPVVGNIWEHTYYFRALGPLYQEAPALPATDRLWLVLGGADSVERERTLRAFEARRFRLVERADFESTTVARLSCRRGTRTPGSPATPPRGLSLPRSPG